MTVVSSRSADEARHEDTFKLAAVVIINVMIITAALFPVVVNRYGLEPSAVWRISSGFLFIANLLQIAFLNRTTQGYVAGFSQRRVLPLAVLSLSLFFYIPLLLCIFGIRQSLAPAFFLTALVAALFQTSLLFADLVISMIGPNSRRH